ncbi:MAG: polysaccharide biosynthesis C-terminal domain-containing protein [Oscillospiraceae bacterium]|nr:polysaccharide biosynthesis C-terminal domain-containing protein [Oscillospiraceae bacterium]
MNKYKSLAMNTAVFAVGSFGSKILMYLLTRLYTHNISSGDNSTKSLLESTANFLIPIVTLSIAEAVIRYGLDREFDKREVFTSACVTEIGGLIGLILLSPLLTLLPYTDGYVIYLVLYIAASSFRQLSSQFVRARGMVRLFALDGILATLSLFCFNVLFISVMHLGVMGFMLSVILSDLCSGIFLWITAKLWQFFNIRLYNSEITKMMLRFSIPMIPTAVLWIITGFSDRLFVRYMDGFAISPDVGDSAAGVYDAASKVPNLISMVSTIFFQAWNMSAITENNSKDRSNFYYRIFSAYQSIMFLAAAFTIALCKPLSLILIDSSKDAAYAMAYKYMPVLIIAVLMMSFNQFLSSIYTATKKTSHSFWTSLVAAVVNLVLNVILIYRYGVHGAVIATFVSYFVCYLIRIVDTRRLIPFKVHHMRFVLNLVILFAMSIAAILEPPYLIPFQAVLVIFMCVFNFSAIMQTVKKILRKD